VRGQITSLDGSAPKRLRCTHKDLLKEIIHDIDMGSGLKVCCLYGSTDSEIHPFALSVKKHADGRLLAFLSFLDSDTVMAQGLVSIIASELGISPPNNTPRNSLDKSPPPHQFLVDRLDRILSEPRNSNLPPKLVIIDSLHKLDVPSCQLLRSICMSLHGHSL